LAKADDAGFFLSFGVLKRLDLFKSTTNPLWLLVHNLRAFLSFLASATAVNKSLTQNGDNHCTSNQTMDDSSDGGLHDAHGQLLATATTAAQQHCDAPSSRRRRKQWYVRM
jgi:hypothetical protein